MRGFPSLHPRERAPAEERAKLAAHTLIGILTETVITYRDRDRLTDGQRVVRFGHIAREWKRISRCVYRLRAENG